MENQIEPAATARSPHRFRYLIDIVVLIAVVFGLELAAEAIYTPKSMEARYVFGGAIQMLEVLVACGLIWMRRERLADIGLKRAKSWPRTFSISVVIAIVVFVGIYLSVPLVAALRVIYQRFASPRVGGTVPGSFIDSPEPRGETSMSA